MPAHIQQPPQRLVVALVSFNNPFLHLHRLFRCSRSRRHGPIPPVNCGNWIKITFPSITDAHGKDKGKRGVRRISFSLPRSARQRPSGCSASPSCDCRGEEGQKNWEKFLKSTPLFQKTVLRDIEEIEDAQLPQSRPADGISHPARQWGRILSSFSLRKRLV